MSGNQELFASLQMFKQGMQEYAVGQVLSNAQEQVHNLQAAGLKDHEQRSAMQAFSNDLALQLGAASGGNAALVESIAGRFGLNATQQAQIEMQEKELGAQVSRQVHKEQQQQLVQRRLYQSQFNQRAAKSVESFDRAGTAVKMLQSKTSVGDSAVRMFLARASGEVGALTEADKEPFGGSSALDRKIKRWAALQATGKLPESDRQELLSLATLIRDKAGEDAQSHANLISEQMSINMEIPADEAMELIYPKKGRRNASNEPSQGQKTNTFNEPGFSIIGE